MTTLLKIERLEVRYGDLIGVADVSLDPFPCKSLSPRAQQCRGGSLDIRKNT